MRTAPKPNLINLAHPVIILGRDDNGKAHASIFPAADAYAAQAAAQLMGMFALNVTSDEVRAYVPKLPKGKLFDSGKAFVPFVKQDLYKSIVTHLPDEQREQAERPRETASGKTEVAVTVEPHHRPESWDKITVGSVVLATEGQFEGWFEAVVIAMLEDGSFRLQWRDYVDHPQVMRRVDQLALINSAYVESD